MRKNQFNHNPVKGMPFMQNKFQFFYHQIKIGLLISLGATLLIQLAIFLFSDTVLQTFFTTPRLSIYSLTENFANQLNWHLTYNFFAHSLLVLTTITYLILLLKYSHLSTGRFSLLFSYLLIIISLLIIDGAILSALSSSLVIIWFARSVYYHFSLSGLLLDALLIVIGFSFACSVYLLMHSWLLSLSGFFLIQALNVFIPRSCSGKMERSDADTTFDKDLQASHYQFSQARLQAENALNSFQQHRS
ncbi:hypothetical protein [Aliikangiella maris]|uniref:Uncharacterized protein n=2 Tax=Aliikangiella maris TaxID=3162458 RepID=A0ABV2BPV5_9GAMM